MSATKITESDLDAFDRVLEAALHNAREETDYPEYHGGDVRRYRALLRALSPGADLRVTLGECTERVCLRRVA